MKILKTGINRIGVLLLGIVALAAPAFAQPNTPPTQVWARNYSGLNLIGQQANTYSFNGGACNVSPFVSGLAPSFFGFSGANGGTTVYYPIAILDANPTLSEVATPTSTTQSSASCSFAATTVNSHTSFTLISGTAGLQEAIISQQQSTPTFAVMLDKYWYQLIAALPTTPTAQTGANIIATVTGNANVSIVDTTQSPWVTYAWNGTKYAPLSTTGGVAFTTVTPVSAPTALSTAAATNGLITTATTGGTIPASSTYRLAATYVTAPGGETAISTDSASTATIATGSGTATNTITVTSPAASTGAVGWRIYMSAASGASLSEILYVSSCVSASTGQTVLNGVCAIGSNAVITAVLTGTATIPAISSAFVTPQPTSVISAIPLSYPPFTNVATISAAATGTLGEVNLPAGFLNTLGRTIEVCGTGFGTTNGTPGTLTVATTLASIPGVTSITPFTAVSGTTTASAVVNFTFCEWITTTAVGATGTLEMHGTVAYNLAGTAATTAAQDLIVAASSTVDLTKQDQLAITLKPTTTAIVSGGAQLRQLTFQIIQ